VAGGGERRIEDEKAQTILVLLSLLDDALLCAWNEEFLALGRGKEYRGY
jgi:hypothetical protein